MKVKDVPQDNEGLNEGKFRDLCYVLNEEGKYTSALSTGWAPKNAAMKQAWEQVDERASKARKKVLSGELSPLGYYMEKNIMNPKLLAQYAGFSTRKVKKHLKPDNFSKLDRETLEKYAAIFMISVDQLKNIEETSEKNE